MTGTFVLKIKLDDKTMRDQNDVAWALRNVSEQLQRFMSNDFGPYGRTGEVLNCNAEVVGNWEVKGEHDDKDE